VSLIAAAGHGPGQHGLVGNVVLIVLFVGGLIALLVLAIRARKRSAQQSARGHDDAERDHGGGA
jgi:Flp pilus assembly protein protease CpaA